MFLNITNENGKKKALQLGSDIDGLKTFSFCQFDLSSAEYC